MELFQSQSEYTVRGAHSCLSCSRSSGSMEIRAASEVDLSGAVCLGLVEGVVGKFQFHTNLDCFLILVQQKGLVGIVPGKHEMYKITKVAVIPLTDAEPQDLKLEFRSKRKLEQRLLAELVKMFTGSNSFYYSLTYDITNTAQRQQQGGEGQVWPPSLAQIDDRFFWNKYMIRDLLEEKSAMSDQWIIPIIQGFVQVQEICIGCSKEETTFSNGWTDKELQEMPESKFLLVLISRRSRHRGGMRYKCRGIDSNGNVANYVETEQLIFSGDDIMSFVQVRGSVPLFWSQEGYRYKPHPKLHKSEEENKRAFQAHFKEQIKIYNKEVIINLVDQIGPEKLIGDAYLKHFLMFNDPNLIYVLFDFHHLCQGRRFENIKLLTEGISNIIDDLKWFRLSECRVLSRQEGVLRVNCMDSLDRTNLSQAFIARHILEQQLEVLKILPQHCCLPQNTLKTFLSMWANSGDAISKQYAGTAAMKSDFTRTGESKLSGVMKDGYRSANRYYLDHFRHAYRQAVIDLMYSDHMTKDMHALIQKQKLAKTLLINEHRRRQKKEIEALILICTSRLIPAMETFLGGWLFVDCNPRLKHIAEQSWDVMFLLSTEACYLAHINKECEISDSCRIALSELESIEFGHQPSMKETSKKIYMKLYYPFSGKSHNEYTLRPVLQHWMAKESLQGIAEIIRRAKREATGSDLPIHTESRHCVRLVKGLWSLLLSFVHFLVPMFRYIIKACRLIRNRRISTSDSDGTGASPVTQQAHERSPVIVTAQQDKGPSEHDTLQENEVNWDHVFSVYLPRDGKITLQVSHYRGASYWEGTSGSTWQYLPSDSSRSSQEDGFISSRSVSTSPSTSSSSRLSSGLDSSVNCSRAASPEQEQKSASSLLPTDCAVGSEQLLLAPRARKVRRERSLKKRSGRGSGNSAHPNQSSSSTDGSLTPTP
ncbi:phosphatidylinositide phosphatase SAC2-like isoform X2 [Narcine bancroftii]|uniref:phosphatidylinositide phosphatase SAC2-like isoform X2 n=1 Tax=Narcine bancroftii TaxID=1343680 RepID=UPI0038319563